MRIFLMRLFIGEPLLLVCLFRFATLITSVKAILFPMVTNSATGPSIIAEWTAILVAQSTIAAGCVWRKVWHGNTFDVTVGNGE